MLAQPAARTAVAMTGTTVFKTDYLDVLRKRYIAATGSVAGRQHAMCLHFPAVIETHRDYLSAAGSAGVSSVAWTQRQAYMHWLTFVLIAEVLPRRSTRKRGHGAEQG